jgi:hypothetical protein
MDAVQVRETRFGRWFTGTEIRRKHALDLGCGRVIAP